jgi:hypothetical protein
MTTGYIGNRHPGPCRFLQYRVTTRADVDASQGRVLLAAACFIGLGR